MGKRGKGRKGGGRKTEPKVVEEVLNSEESTSSSVTNKPKAKAKPKPKAEALTTSNLVLSKKPVLTKEDVTCPICWSVLFMPTTLPCNHSLCEQCFRKHVEETSLCCPCCRLRLSVWSRKAIKANKLLDEELWTRIQKEFPKYVTARINGQDTQDILDDDMASLTPNSPSLMESSSVLVRDGTICNGSGEIRTELEQMIKQHQNDIEMERLREESASANLIKQLQEEERRLQDINRTKEEQDFLLAQQLYDEEKASSSTNNFDNTNKTCRNLMKEWAETPSVYVAGSSKTNTPNNSRRVGQSSKKKQSGKGSTSSKRKSSTVADVSKASQDVMSKFLSTSQSMSNRLGEEDGLNTSFSSSSTSTVFNGPCSSSGIPNHDIKFSAFSPMKATGKPIESSLETPVTFRFSSDEYSPKVVKSLDDSVITKTPDSINSEVDRHFRPIRGAPKTPPRRRADGTFLPEPKLVRTTPIRPSTSASSSFYASPLKQICETVKPSCATIEKRVSNDSGRASNESASPSGERNFPLSGEKRSENPTSSFSAQLDDRGCTSDDYRVTPESDDAAGKLENVKKRGICFYATESASKKAKVNEESGAIFDQNHFSSIDVPVIKKEPLSPSILDPNFCQSDSETEMDSTVKIEPGTVKVESVKVPAIGNVGLEFVPDIVKIEDNDREYMDNEAKALELFRLKAEQEAADRAFAEALQRSFNRGILNPRGKTSRERYSLRSWLQPQVKQEVKQEVHRD